MALIISPLQLDYINAKNWLEQFQFIVTVHFKDADKKSAFLANCGSDCFNLLAKLVLPKSVTAAEFTFAFDDDDNVKNLRILLLNYFKPQVILHYERFKFFSLKQGGSILREYLANLRSAASTCQFGTILDGLLLTQFINGLNDLQLQKKLLLQSNLTLDIAFQSANLHEVASGVCTQSSTFTTVANVNKNDKKKNVSKSNQKDYICYSCGRKDHLRDKCRYKNSQCNICKKTGHISTVCKSKKESISFLEVDDCSSVVAAINGCGFRRILDVNGLAVEFLVDTGSPITIIPKKFISDDISLSEASKVTCYNGSPLLLLGTTTVNLSYGSQNQDFLVHVIEGESTPLLGCNVLNSFQMVQVAPIVQDAHDVIYAELIPRADVSTLPKFKPRSLPFSIKSKVEDDIREKVKAGILVPIDSPVMACPIVPVSKPDGSIRVCGDFSCTANKLIDAEQYPLPTLEQITTDMANCVIFSKLDLQQAYLQLPLSSTSQQYTTISTHMGFFKYTKLPFGISAAPRIFQQFIDKLIQMPHVKAYQDDILIGGTSLQDHDATLSKVLHILDSHSLVINKEKSEMRKSVVHFLGYLLGDGGLQPDPSRLAQLSNLASPTNRNQLKSILGTLQFYSRFTSKHSAIAAPLFRLLSPKVQFKWSSVEEKALRMLLAEIQLVSQLVFYDLQKPLYLSTDASIDGLGCVLSHDPDKKEIIHCVSRTLTKAERNYSNIEREALAVVFGVKRLHQYLAGRKFTLQTDHRPLQFLMDTAKAIPDRVSARLQRWCLILKAYDFDIQTIKGNSMLLPDLLSRVTEKTSDCSGNVLDESSVCFLLQEDNIPLFRDIQLETQQSELRKIVYYVQRGWPKRVPRRLLPYTRNKMEYTVNNGCLYRGVRLVVPPALRSKLLHLYHDNHPGIIKMRQLLRQFVWWPTLDADTQKLVSECEQCASNQSSRVNVSLQSWPDTTSFFERIHMDIFFYEEHSFLILVDSFSSFVDVHQLQRITSHCVIMALQKTFRYFGSPQSLVCDNGKQFVSVEFRNFLKSSNIDLILTPPYHSPSNGRAERAIRSVKLFLAKNGVVDNWEFWLSQFCKVQNFFPNSNGCIPCREYLKVSPKSLMTKVLLSDKRGVIKATAPSVTMGTTVIPLANEKVAHRGGIITTAKRNRIPNRRIFNSDFAT